MLHECNIFYAFVPCKYQIKVNILTQAVRESIVSVSASIAVVSVIVGLARALTSPDLTHLVLCTIDVTVTFLAVRVAIETQVTSANR